jgi:hypothetical protein
MKTMRFSLLLSLFHCFLPLHAAACDAHAVLHVASGYEKQMREAIEQAGGRVAVTAGNIWILRIPDASFGMLEGHPGTEKLVGHEAAKRGTKPEAEDDLTTYLAYVKQALPGEQDSLHYVAEGPCGIEPDPSTQDTDKNGTSDLMMGSTAIAVILIKQTDALGPPAFTWTSSVIEETKANIMLNMAWWTDRAADYGVEKTFHIRFYEPDDPVTHIPWDPTIYSVSAWRTRIMSNLGYTEGTLTERMRAFVNHLRQEEETDWGFLAFVFHGSTSYRSNAMLLGPATNVSGPAARSGLVFAHEAGHIYGLRDEYAERAPITHHFVINGLANLNADFRNHIHAPCMMKNNWGMCSYNPVHLQWSDEVMLTTVKTEPENAPFEVEFLHPVSMQPGFYTQRFRGETRLPLGRHMHARLTGLERIVLDHQEYINPQWDLNGEASVLVSIDQNNSSPVLTLTYQPAGAEADLEITYLRAGIEVPGRRIYRMEIDESGNLGMASMDGIGVFSKGELEYIDPPFYGTHLEYSYRESNDMDLTSAGFYFASQRDEIVSWADGQISVIAGDLRINTFTRVAADEQGRVWGMGEQSLSLFHGSQRTEFSPQAGGLRGLDASVLHTLPDGRLLVGYSGGRTGGDTEGMQLFDPASGIWQSLDNLLTDKRVTNIRAFNEKLYVVCHNRLVVLSMQLEKIKELDFSQVVGTGRINDVLPGLQQDFFLATQAGLIHYRDESDWHVYEKQNSTVSDNIITSLVRDEKNRILAGTMNNGLMVFHFKSNDNISSVNQIKSAGRGSLLIYPNPATYYSTIVLTGLEQSGELLWVHVTDMLGRIVLSDMVMAVPGTDTMQLPLSVQNLRNGVYQVRAQNGKQMLHGKLLVTGR